MRILVTGGLGFLGSHLSLALPLHARGHEVRIFDALTMHRAATRP